MVALLHREEYYHKSDSQKDREWREKHEQLRDANDPECLLGYAELIVDKQRNGPTGVVGLQWDGRSTSFRDRAEHRHG